jgi:hypothetical protein
MAFKVVMSAQTFALLVIYILGHQKKDHGLPQIQLYDKSSEKNCDENAKGVARVSVS